MDVKKYRAPKIQFTELKKVNKLKCPSEDISLPLGGRKINHKWERDGGTWDGKWTGG